MPQTAALRQGSAGTPVRCDAFLHLEVPIEASIQPANRPSIAPAALWDRLSEGLRKVFDQSSGAKPAARSEPAIAVYTERKHKSDERDHQHIWQKTETSSTVHALTFNEYTRWREDVHGVFPISSVETVMCDRFAIHKRPNVSVHRFTRTYIEILDCLYILHNQSGIRPTRTSRSVAHPSSIRKQLCIVTCDALGSAC